MNLRPIPDYRYLEAVPENINSTGVYSTRRSTNMAAAILQVNLKKCPHFAGIKTLNSYPHSLTMSHIWQNYHPAAEKRTTVAVIGQSEEGKVSIATKILIRTEPVLD